MTLFCTSAGDEEDDQPRSLLHTFSGTSRSSDWRDKERARQTLSYALEQSPSSSYHAYRSRGKSSKLPLGQEDSDDEEQEVYIVYQRRGYFSILFSVLQTGVLAAMMIQCGVAPFKLNPMIGPYPDALSYWGGKNAYLILDEHETWRLITPIFLHAGILHLLGNVAVQLDAGEFFEREWGSLSWLIVYLGSTVGSSVLSCIVMPNMVSVGSSGAVCGLFGAKLSEIFCRACESAKSSQGRVGHEVRSEQLRGVLCSLFIVGLFSFVPYVDWGAHLGGMLAGWCIGMVLFSCRIKTVTWRLLWLLVGLAMSAVYFGLIFLKLYGGLQPTKDLKDVCAYYQQFYPDYVCRCQI